MKYCKRCLYPENHPLGITFDDEGVCSGCRVHEEKDGEINWEERFRELGRLVGDYRGKNRSGYDCIIPVTGNGDSHFVVHTMKKVLGLNPLLVTYNIQYNTKIGIRNLANLLTKLDCDHLQYTVNPTLVKKITWLAMHRFGDMYWHCLAGEQTFPVQVASKMDIPLIVWGVNGWLDQVGMFSHWDLVEMTKKVRKEHSLRGFDAEVMHDEKLGITPKVMQAFKYPADEELEKAHVRGIYLGNFVRWDAQKQIELMIELYGYETTDQERTFNRYESIHCHHNAGTHDYVKFLKYGYGKVTDHACRDIRLKRMTREEGIERVRQYESKRPRDLDLFLTWVGMSGEEFLRCLERFRDPKIWERDSAGGWRLKDSVTQHAGDDGVARVRLEKIESRPYVKTSSREPGDPDDEYILMGRAYIDQRNYHAVTSAWEIVNNARLKK